ncbi:MAG TPA: nuclear transport factor 2 family protein [Terriglobales bacterium]|nr:nuclear transport factor 2 family protein [Terriglobales bacterium]
MRPVLTLLTAAVLTIGLTSNSQRPAPEAAVRSVLAAQTAAWNRGDISGFMDGYWKSPQTQFIGSSGVTLGWTTVRDRYLKNYPDAAARGQLTFTGLTVTVLSPDVVYVLGHFQLQRAHDQPHGVFTLLFRRFPQGWKIISDHTTATQ